MTFLHEKLASLTVCGSFLRPMTLQCSYLLHNRNTRWQEGTVLYTSVYSYFKLGYSTVKSIARGTGDGVLSDARRHTCNNRFITSSKFNKFKNRE